MNRSALRTATHSVPGFLATAWASVAVIAGPLLPPNNPDAMIDLMTVEGVRMVAGEWRFHEAAIREVDHRRPGPDRKPSGPPNRTHDLDPHAGGPDFDDSQWEAIDPPTLPERRGGGRLSFVWYRIRLTIPEQVAGMATSGSTVVLEMVLDDYAEVWVDGKLPQVLGQSGGPLIGGWNAPNRVVLARSATPGQTVQVAVAAANGPFSEPPGNFIWVRSAVLEFYRPGRLTHAREVPFEVIRLDPAINELIPPDARLERLADGFAFTEGPVWVPAAVGGAGARPIDEGYLLFSDPNRNVIYRLTGDGELSLFRVKSGYTGVDLARYRQPGSNGLALDKAGRLTICEHGNRRVTRMEKNGQITVLADRFEGRRLNSPNDLVYRSDGALYFSDPPFGLPRLHDDPARELAHTGVYCLIDGTLKLVSTDLTGPNGLAFSPDEKHLYVTNWDPAKKVVMRYDAARGGELRHGTVFFDMAAAPQDEALDGVKVDRGGNLYVSGPGGLWVIDSTGKHLGTIQCPEPPANMAWGDQDGRTLYLTARSGVYRLRMNVAGHGSWTPGESQ